MKIIPEIIVKNPTEIPNHIKDTVDNIIGLLHQRVLQSNSIKNIEAKLFLYIGIDTEMNDKTFVLLKDKLYYGIDDSMNVMSETVNFNSTFKKAIEKHISIPQEIDKCFVYLSLSSVEKSKLTDAKKKKATTYQSVEPIFALDEVVMNMEEKDAIMRAISLIKERNLIYNKWNFKKVDKHTKSILCFHGVSGTGKTMAAHAIANFLGKKILIGSYAQIESEFVGVGAKNLKAFFDCASDQDAVLFIDEADTFLSKRLPSSNDSAKHYNSMSNELYQLVENFDGCIIFASNHIKDFDPAIISRIIEPIEFKLPDLDARKKIIDNLFQEEFPIEGGKCNSLITELADLTEGFSGRDIRKALLICNADAVYQLKIKAGKEDDSIVIPVNMIKNCFDSVRKAKNKLDAALGKRTTINLMSEFTDENKKKTRYMQMAAHTLLVDGVIEPKEKTLYNDLSRVMGVKVPLSQESLPSIEEICSQVSSREESLQIIDVVTRMAACDEEVPESELDFVVKVANILGLGCIDNEVIREYTLGLSKSYKQMSCIKDKLGKCDVDILSELRKEYTEGAAYYHLAEMFRDGSSFMGGVKKNTTMANYYFDKAKESNYFK